MKEVSFDLGSSSQVFGLGVSNTHSLWPARKWHGGRRATSPYQSFILAHSTAPAMEITRALSRSQYGITHTTYYYIHRKLFSKSSQLLAHFLI